MYVKTRGLVIRVTNYNDSDAFLTILTPDRGRISVKAPKLLRRPTKLAAPCQLLACGEYTLFEYNGKLTLNEAESIELFQPLRGNLEKLSLAFYFTQIADLTSQEDIPNPELLSLLLNCLHALCYMDVHDLQVKAVFELRATCLAGYYPDLSGCACCGKSDADRFNVSMGKLVCSGCHSAYQEGLRMPVSRGSLEAMRYICNCDPKKLFSFRIFGDALEQLSQVTETYLTTQLERGFRCLDFYKSLSQTTIYQE